ncbi:Citrate synthase [Geodia barretti]|uniref:Citrate synthase n=1 Tax=Geodia barretti TaxID=519541 RepID=A0AA35X4E8_GEOBA|nr:Citrate synthase [Geodia barretti]
MATEQKVQIHRGLRDVLIDRTRSSFIDGDVGKLLYRGYNIDDLATKSTFEETIYLLLYSELPNREQLDAFDAELRANRALPEEVLSVISITQKSHPMDVLRTAVSALSAFDPDTEDNSAEATLRKGIRLTAQASTIVAAHARIREGKQPIAPNSSLSHASKFPVHAFW